MLATQSVLLTMSFTNSQLLRHGRLVFASEGTVGAGADVQTTADMNTYLKADVGAAKVFFLTFAGLYLPCMLIQVLGAAFGAAALSGQVPTWGDAFGDGLIGPLIAVALEPLHGFGKFLLVILSLGIISEPQPKPATSRRELTSPGCSEQRTNRLRSKSSELLAHHCSSTDPRDCLQFSMSFQTFLPFLARFPRFLIPIVATAIYLPVALVGANNFFAALSSFLGLIGYWASIFSIVFFIEVRPTPRLFSSSQQKSDHLMSSTLYSEVVTDRKSVV